MNQGRNFFWTGPGPHSGGLKSKFHIFSYKNWILLVFKSDVGPGGIGVTRGVTKGVTREGYQADHLCLLIYSYPLLDLYPVIGENTLASHPSDGFLHFLLIPNKVNNNRGIGTSILCKYLKKFCY
jgi:hypothetical protein